MLDRYSPHFNSTHPLPYYSTMLRHPFYFLIVASVVSAFSHVAAAKSDALPWKRSSEFNEASFTTTVDPKIRINVNAPLDEKGSLPTRRGSSCSLCPTATRWNRHSAAR